MCRARVNRLANILLGVAFLMLSYGLAKLAFAVDPAPLPWVAVLMALAFGSALVPSCIFLVCEQAQYSPDCVFHHCKLCARHRFCRSHRPQHHGYFGYKS